jgi:hypothetical protein
MNQQPSWFAKQQPQHSSKMCPPRTTGRVIFKIILYFVGATIAEFGLLGGALSATSSSNPVGCLTFSVGVFGLGGSIFIFIRKEYYLHCLPRLQYLWWVLGVSCAFLIIFGVLAGVTYSQTNSIRSVILASILALYGVSFIWVAHLKPPVAQQINESVYQILKTMPEQQLVVSDLLALLRKKYKNVGSALNQYLGNLEYIELINIPGSPVMIYRMKSQKQVVATAPMTLPTVSTSRSQVGSVPFAHQMPLNQKIMSLPVQFNPPNPQETKNASISSADQKTVPVLPVAMSNQQPAVSLAQSMMLPGSKPIDTLVSSPKQVVLPVPVVLHSSVPPSPLSEEQKAIRIFCCYAHEDEQLLDKLKIHLKPQERQGLIQIWYDRNILAGAQWEQAIEEQLNTAQIILLLVSPDFIASDYCYTKEMQRVLERHEHGEVRAIPIILRPTDWRITPLKKLQALPKDGKPITTWDNRDNAYLDAATGIRNVVATFLAPPQQSKKQVQTPNNSQRAAEEEVELIRARCIQGKLIITNKKIAIELTAFGNVVKSQTLLRTSLTSIDSKLVMPSLFGQGGGTNLAFHGKGRELLKAELVPPGKAQEILALLS